VVRGYTISPNTVADGNTSIRKLSDIRPTYYHDYKPVGDWFARC